eukprot:scaffold2639_cov88-Cylindrotheca_fusiformis.AAC.2
MPNSIEVIRRVLYTRFDYLLGLNRSWDSDTMRQAIDEALEKAFSFRRREFVATTDSESETSESETMEQAIDEALQLDFSTKKTEIVSIYLKLANYERKVVLSLLELRLWENCGASVVIPNVLPFLDTFDVEDYFRAHSPSFW